MSEAKSNKDLTQHSTNELKRELVKEICNANDEQVKAFLVCIKENKIG